MGNKPNWSKQAVGASGVRRIVPMLGVDYIAGQITIKKKPYTGGKKASIGGRTRFWSTTNFLNVASGQGRTTPLTAAELSRQQAFGDTSKFAHKTYVNPQTLQSLMTSYATGVISHGVDPADCLNLYQYLWRAAYSFQASGGTLPDVATWPLV